VKEKVSAKLTMGLPEYTCKLSSVVRHERSIGMRVAPSDLGHAADICPKVYVRGPKKSAPDWRTGRSAIHLITVIARCHDRFARAQCRYRA
jgi:hypothetical protein